MDSAWRRMLMGVALFTGTVALAVGGYMLAGWSLLDAVYMVVITIFGVGYGEVRPLESPVLKWFTIFVIIAGALSVAAIVSGLLQAVTEGEIHRALNYKRMTQTISQLEDHVIICGYGRIGQMIALRLTEEKRPFVVIDSSPERILAGQEDGFLMYLGNATDDDCLRHIGIERARAVATVLPDDAANVFITLTARELNANVMILARGEAASTEKKLRLAGANHVVLPTTISALRMAQLLLNPSTTDFLDKTEGGTTLNNLLAEIDIQIAEITIEKGSNLIGSNIGDIEVRGRGTFIIVALRRSDGETIMHPSQDVFLRAQDAVIIMGHQGDLPQFVRRHVARRDLRYRGAKLR
jgi:voltage-gated potassium channel